MSTEKKQTAAPSLVGQLDTEYVQAAQGDRAQRMQELCAIAAKARGTQEVHRSTRSLAALFLIVGIPITLLCLYQLGQIAAHINDPHFANAKDWKMWAGVLALLGILPLAMAVLFLRSFKKPWLIFTEQGLSNDNLAQPLPWTAIEEYRVLVHEQIFVPFSVQLSLYLHENAERPTLNGKRLKKPELALITPGTIRGMNGNKFAECFQTWWHAGLARAELAQMGED